MRIRMIADMSGLYNGIELPRRGNEVDLPDAMAQELVTQGVAIPVRVLEPEERAVAPTVAEEQRAAPVIGEQNSGEALVPGGGGEAGSASTEPEPPSPPRRTRRT